MKKDMTEFGIGKKLGLIVLPFLAAAIAAGIWLPGTFAFDHLSHAMLMGMGIGMVVIGISLNMFSAAFMMKAFKNKRLATAGPYALSRNPMYASFIVFTIPGIALVCNNWLLALVSLALYGGVTLLVGEEELWLEKNFGEEYRAYKTRTGRIFPKVWQS
jgi:protein-S-isoprenylcysteine O-methyltransferase Ste14